MRTYSAAVEAQLASGKIKRRLAIKFELQSGNYGFLTGYRGQVTVGGVLYVGSGGLIEISRPDETVSAEASDLVVQLASHRRINGQNVKLFDPHLLNSIEDEVWFLQPAIVYRFWLNDNHGIDDVEQLHIRQIYSVEHIKSKAGRRIKAVLSTPASMARVSEAKRNGPDLQRLIDPTDTGYDDVLTAASDPIYWGRTAPKPGA